MELRLGKNDLKYQLQEKMRWDFFFFPSVMVLLSVGMLLRFRR